MWCFRRRDYRIFYPFSLCNSSPERIWAATLAYIPLIFDFPAEETIQDPSLFSLSYLSHESSEMLPTSPDYRKAIASRRGLWEPWPIVLYLTNVYDLLPSSLKSRWRFIGSLAETQPCAECTFLQVFYLTNRYTMLLLTIDYVSKRWREPDFGRSALEVFHLSCATTASCRPCVSIGSL